MKGMIRWETTKRRGKRKRGLKLEVRAFYLVDERKLKASGEVHTNRRRKVEKLRDGRCTGYLDGIGLRRFAFYC